MYKKRERKQALIKQHTKNKRLQEQLEELENEYKSLADEWYESKLKASELRDEIIWYEKRFKTLESPVDQKSRKIHRLTERVSR